MKKSKFSEEQIVKVLQEAATGQSRQADLCSKHGISLNDVLGSRLSRNFTTYAWDRLGRITSYGGAPSATASVNPTERKLT